MSALPLLVWVVASAPSVDAAPPTSDVALLMLSAPDADSALAHAVVDATAIYTRDLHVTIRAVTEPAVGTLAPTGTIVSRARELLQQTGARLAFWYTPQAGDALGPVDLYSIDRMGVLRKEVLHGVPDRPALCRVMALKLRARVTATTTTGEAAGADADAKRSDDQKGAVAPAASAPGKTAATKPTATAVAKRAPERAAAGDGDRSDGALRRQAGPASSTESSTSPFLVLAAGYGASIGADSMPRHALSVQAGVALGERFRLLLDTRIGGVRHAPSTGAGQVTGSLRDVPVHVGARALLPVSGGVVLGAGPSAGVHVLSADVRGGDGLAHTTLTASGTAGFELAIQGRGFGPIDWQARLWAERLLPRTRFLYDDQPVLDSGAWAVGLCVELVLPVR